MNEAKTNEYDLLVVGAGIYGAWTAYDASLRGLKVLLIDKGDIANATSSASSKLIHGGLRYLEQFNFSLVKKSVKERQLLFKIAPHRVKPLKFTIPVYSGSRIPAWKYKIGLSIYDWFAKTQKPYKHCSYSPDAFLEQNQFLKNDKLKKGLIYFDAGTDDFRYTLEIVDGAVRNGTELRTYCELKSYTEENGVITGAIIKNLNEDSKSIKCKAAVNATGQWTDELLKSKYCRLSKGIHIISPDCGAKNAVLLLSPIDGRVFFMIPWYGRTMIGTSDTDFKGDLNDVKAEDSDINYLLDSVNHYLKTPINKEEILNSFAGLRVLKNEEGHPSSVTRDWELKEEKPGLFLSIGGKLTSARHDCSSMVDEICRYLNHNSQCSTASRPFPWAGETFSSLKNEINEKGRKLDLNEDTINLLISRQGLRADQILNMISSDHKLSEPIIQNLPFTKAEWLFSIREEYITQWDDLVRRRFPIKLIHKMTDLEESQLKQSANQILKSMNKKIL